MEKQAAETAGSTFVAALGIGTLLLSIESERILVIGANSDFSLDMFPSYLIGFACVVLLVLAYYRAPRLFRPRMPVEFIVAVLFSASKLVSMGQSIIPINLVTLLITNILTSLGGALLLFIWFRELALFGARSAAKFFAFGMVFLAGLNLFTLLLKDAVVRDAVILLPIISVGCLFYLRKMTPHKSLTDSASAQGTTPDTTFEQAFHKPSHQPDQLLLSARIKSNKNGIMIIGSFYAVFTCLAVIFGQIHNKWLLLQDGATVSLVVQVGTAIGTVGSSLCILAFLIYFWNRRGIEICEQLLFGITAVTLWLSAFTELSWVLMFVVLLNVMQKLTFLLILLSPFIIAERRDWLRPLWASYLAFDFGKLLSVTIFVSMTEQLYIISSIVALAILLASNMVIAYIDRPTDSSEGNSAGNHAGSSSLFQGTTLEGLDQSADGSASDPSDKDRTRGNKLQHSCDTLAGKYALTRREREILFLLARGRTSQHIASSLVIAQTTIKTHQRSIYAKLGVHSQQELLTLVEFTIDQQRGGGVVPLFCLPRMRVSKMAMFFPFPPHPRSGKSDSRKRIGRVFSQSVTGTPVALSFGMLVTEAKRCLRGMKRKEKFSYAENT